MPFISVYTVRMHTMYISCTLLRVIVSIADFGPAMPLTNPKVAKWRQLSYAQQCKYNFQKYKDKSKKRLHLNAVRMQLVHGKINN